MSHAIKLAITASVMVGFSHVKSFPTPDAESLSSFLRYPPPGVANAGDEPPRQEQPHLCLLGVGDRSLQSH
jgi:hypothetical protein